MANDTDPINEDEVLRELSREIPLFEKEFEELLSEVAGLSPETAKEFTEFRELMELQERQDKAAEDILSILDGPEGEG
jgi:DNA-directed RNA polymerase subunit F